MSGKNSADIRMVVDALDLCYSKQHIDMFALLSGDSDFSPLVSKLKENDKRVIGCGVKSSTSDLLIAELRRVHLLRRPRRAQAHAEAAPRRRAGAKAERRRRPTSAERRSSGWSRSSRSLEQRLRPAVGLDREADDARVYPGFNESYYGYRTFADLLEDAASEGLSSSSSSTSSAATIESARPTDRLLLTSTVVAPRRGFATSVTAPRPRGAETTASTSEPEVVYVPARVHGGQGRRASHPRDADGAAHERHAVPTLVESHRRQAGAHARDVVHGSPGRRRLCRERADSRHGADAQAALDKAVAIAKRGDAAVVYLNADIARIPKSRGARRA